MFKKPISTFKLPNRKEKTLEDVLEKCTLPNQYNNDIRFSLNKILEPKKVINVEPVLPSEKKNLEYIFESTGYSIININNNNKKPIFIAAFSLIHPINYYHWILNNLPRIYMCYKAGARLFYNSSNSRMDPQSKLKFIKQTLALFDDEIRFINKKDIFQIAYPNYSIKILYPYLPDDPRTDLYIDKSMNHFHICRLTDYTRKMLFSHINININNNPKKKIRIMRKAGREISNSKEVNKYLEGKGFQIVNFENANIKEQLQLIADSKIIFATHGSGLANCSVLSKNSLIIEVCPERYYIKNKNKPKVHFHLLASIVGCNYEYLMADNNFIININDIDNCLNKYE